MIFCDGRLLVHVTNKKCKTKQKIYMFWNINLLISRTFWLHFTFAQASLKLFISQYEEVLFAIFFSRCERHKIRYTAFSIHIRYCTYQGTYEKLKQPLSWAYQYFRIVANEWIKHKQIWLWGAGRESLDRLWLTESAPVTWPLAPDGVLTPSAWNSFMTAHHHQSNSLTGE